MTRRLRDRDALVCLKSSLSHLESLILIYELYNIYNMTAVTKDLKQAEVESVTDPTRTCNHGTLYAILGEGFPEL